MPPLPTALAQRLQGRIVTAMIIYTIGHSTRQQDELIGLLREFDIGLLADVRSYPRSRSNPQFNAEVLGPALGELGIAYRHMKALGGRRGRQDLPGPAPNGLWRVEAFRNYADYALGPEFRTGLTKLMADAAQRTTAVMCAEATWWRCHRRIVTDYVLAAGHEVQHILGSGKAEAARLTEGAAVQADGAVHYPAPQGELF